MNNEESTAVIGDELLVKLKDFLTKNQGIINDNLVKLDKHSNSVKNRVYSDYLEELSEANQFFSKYLEELCPTSF